MFALGVGGRSESGVVGRQRRWTLLYPLGCVAVLAALGFVTSSFADNVVSKPVGFLRLTATSNQEILVSIPFDAFDASINAVLKGQLTGATNAAAADHVFKWDVSAQQYLSAFLSDNTGQTNQDGFWFEDDVNWITSTLAFHPGEGFWIESRHPGTQAVYLAGTIVLAATNVVTLGAALNLFSYPFSSRIALNDSDLAADGAYGAAVMTDADLITDVVSNRNFWLLDDTNSPNHWKWLDEDNVLANEFLTLGRGYWYNRRTTNEFTWSELRPYANLFPPNNDPPCVTAMTFNAQGDRVTLTISTLGATGEVLEIYYQDISPTNAFDSTNGWRVAAQGLSTSNQTVLHWTDNGSGGRGAITTVFARYYVVARGDIDSDGDGLPDARETFIYHTDPMNADTDGDGMSDGWEVASGFNPFVDEPGVVPQTGLRLWLKADSLSLTNGQKVSAWADQSGRTNPVSQGTSACQPVFATNGLNGKPVVRFDGSDDSMAGSVGSITSPVTMVVVTRFNQLNQPAGDYDYVLRIGNGSASYGQVSISRLAPNSGYGPVNAYYAWLGASVVAGPVLPGQQGMILTAVHDAGSPRHKLYINGVAQSVSNYTQALSLNGAVELGRYSNAGIGSHYLNGDVAEVLVYDRAMSDADRGGLESYLKAKYGFNDPPVVNAGPDMAVVQGASAHLQGQVTDDGYPVPPGTATSAWTKVMGPGTAAFADAASADTTVQFSQAGAYRLRLTASDGVLTTSDDVDVMVNIAEATNVPQGGLRLWVYADGLALTNGESIGVWKDASGWTNSLVQTQAVCRPVYEVDAVNGRSAVRFDGTNDSLGGAVGSMSSPVTLVVVGRFNKAVQGTNDYDYLIRIGNGGVSNGHASISRFAAANPYGHGANEYYSWLGGTGNNFVTGPELPGQEWLVLVAEHATNAILHRLYMDGEERTVDPYSQPLQLDGTVELGRYAQSGTGTHYLDGDIAEALIYNRLLTTSERQVLEDYLKRKYGVNHAPIANAGEDQRVIEGAVVNLDGTVTDDGLPESPGVVTTLWTKVQGPGDVSFGDAASADTTVQFSKSGTYVLRLTAWDGASSASDEMQIAVRAAGTTNVPSAGLRLWLAADDISLTNDAPVALWKDGSGWTNDLAQTQDASRPRFVAEAVNGKPAVRFDGTNDYLGGAVGAMSSPLTMIIVGRFGKAVQGANDYDYLIRIGNGATSNGHVSISRFANANPYGHGVNEYYSWLGGTGNHFVTGPVLEGQEWLLLAAEHDTNAPLHRLFLNGQGQTVDAYNQPLTLDGTVELGRYAQGGSGSHYLDGDIAEVLVYDRALPDGERESIESYLKIKYGLGCTDCDGDGMPDAWELQYFGNLTNTAAGDFDGDGVSNLREYQRGTNPTNALSVNVMLYASSLIGSNVYDGLSATVTNGHGPKLNIQAAALEAVSGDTVSIAEGTYREAILKTDASINLVPNDIVTVDPN